MKLESGSIGMLLALIVFILAIVFTALGHLTILVGSLFVLLALARLL